MNQFLSIQSSVSSTNISNSSTDQRTFSMRDEFLAPYNIVLARFLPGVFIFRICVKIQDSKRYSTAICCRNLIDFLKPFLIELHQNIESCISHLN